RVRQPEERPVEAQPTALAERPRDERRIGADRDLAHYQDIQRQPQRPRDFAGDNHAAGWQREHHCPAVAVGQEQLCQLPARGDAILVTLVDIDEWWAIDSIPCDWLCQHVWPLVWSSAISCSNIGSAQRKIDKRWAVLSRDGLVALSAGQQAGDPVEVVAVLAP